MHIHTALKYASHSACRNCPANIFIKAEVEKYKTCAQLSQMLIFILYAVQGCSHSPTLISNTDNEETAAVTMETTEDTEACKVVPGNW